MPSTRFYLRSYPEPDDMAAHAAGVEGDGWDGLLLTDSQNLSMDVVACLHRAAAATSRLTVGTAVSNLTSRHPAVVASTFATLHHLYGGRAELGIGRGDTALELIGIRPPSAAEFDRQVQAVQAYLSGRDVDVSGFESRITWLPIEGDGKVPVNVFGSGPHVITAGAHHADRVTVTVGAEPERVRWAVDLARDAARTAGRRAEDLEVGAFVVVGVGTNQRALESLVRGNASISAHFQRNVTSALDPADAQAVDAVTKDYDFYHHGLEHAGQAQDLDEQFLDRFCVVGPPDHCVERIQQLLDLDLDHLVFVGASRDIEQDVRRASDHLLGAEVLPALKESLG